MTLSLDSRLEKDCHRLFVYNEIGFLLNKNATIPWLILVPKTQHKDLLDVEESLRNRLMSYSQVAQTVLRQMFAVEKINFAAIGNVVSQLHLHVVGRHSEDACWPDVVWGADYEVKSYTEEGISSLKTQLLNQLNQAN